MYFPLKYTNVSFYVPSAFFSPLGTPLVPMQWPFGHSGGKTHLTNAFLTHILLWDVQKMDSPNTLCSLPWIKLPKFHRQNVCFPWCKVANCIFIQVIDVIFLRCCKYKHGTVESVFRRMQNAPLNYKYSAWKVLSHFLRACWRIGLCWEMAS